MSERERNLRRAQRTEIRRELDVMRASRLSGCSTEGLGLELLVATMINLAETVEGVSDTLRDIHEGGA